MTHASITIHDIDSTSRMRGVGRYVEALKTCILALHPSRPVHINPFLSFSGAQSPSTNVPFSKDTTTVAVIHDLIPLKYPNHFPAGIKGKLYRYWNKRQAKKYTHIVTDSAASKADIHSFLAIPEERIHVIYPFSPLVSTESPNEHFARPKDLPTSIVTHGFTLYVGDGNWHKNIALIAQSAIAANTPLVCVGSVFSAKDAFKSHPELAELDAFFTIQKTRPDLIVCLGYVESNDLLWLYKNALANILVSRDEGFGYSYIEAAACGTPSILANIAVFNEISNQLGAVFVDNTSADSVAREIVRLKNTPELVLTLGKEAIVRSLLFSPQQFAADWEKLLCA